MSRVRSPDDAPYGERSSVGRAPVCGTGCRGFKSRRSPHRNEPLAQLVEHMTFNHGVTGSIPVWLTIQIIYGDADVAKLADALDLGSSAFGHVGSSPSIRTNNNQYQDRQ